MAAHVFWAMHFLSNVSALHHQSPTRNPTATRECRHGIHRRHCHCKKTIEDHQVRIKEVFECFREAGSKMRAEKCDFMPTKTKYLGRVVSAEGIKPGPEAVAKIQEWTPPRNKEEFQSFLGFANYYRTTFLSTLPKWNPCRSYSERISNSIGTRNTRRLLTQ